MTIQSPFPQWDIKAYSKLIREIRCENRFFLSEESNNFVLGLINYSTRFKTHRFSSGEHFYRARINEFQMGRQHFHPEQMGPPPAHKAVQGRLNPVGVPYLYLASDVDTAVSEVRPWIGCGITLAQFCLNRDISVVNFSNKVFANVTPGDGDAAAEKTWMELVTCMFSMPFDPRDDTAYVPTQYVTERIKLEGFGGILYDSALNKDGYNLTLFDHGTAKPDGRLLEVEVLSISYDNRVSEVRLD